MVPVTGAGRAGKDDGGGAQGSPQLTDELVDGLDRAFRRLRRSLVRPTTVDMAIPSLGRPLELAKVLALDAVHELTTGDGPVSVKDVAATLRLEHSTVSRLMGELENDGLLVRGVDERDRRRATLALTATGAAVVADTARMRRLVTRTMLADWDAADVRTLTRLLARIADTAADRLEALPALVEAELEVVLRLPH